MADEIINIGLFELDTSRLEASLSNLQDSYFELKKEAQGYSNLGKEQQKVINELIKANLKLAASGQEQSDAYKENEKAIKDLNEAQTQNLKNQQNTQIQVSRVGREITATTKSLQAYMDSTGKFNTLQDAATAAMEKQISNINDARASNTELLRVRNQLNPAIEAEAKLITQLNARLDSNNDFIKQNASAYERTKIGIGNYAEGIREAFKDTNLFGGALQTLGPLAKVAEIGFKQVGDAANDVTSSFKDYIQGQAESKAATLANNVAQEAFVSATNAATVAQERAVVVGFAAARGTATQTEAEAANTAAMIANAAATEAQAAATATAATAQRTYAQATTIGTVATKVFTLALAATGIGLVVAGIALLIDYFKRFTPIVDVFEQAFAGVGAVIKQVQRGIATFITGLSDLEGTIKKIGAFLVNPIKGFKDLASSMGDAYNAAAQLQKAQQDLEDAMEAQEIASAKNRAEIEKLNIQSRDKTKSDEERIDLLQKAAKLEQQDFEQRKKNADEQLRIAQQQIINEAELTKSEAAELRKRGFNYKEFVETRTNNTDELFEALKTAQLSQVDIERELTANLEKNINRQNKLLEDQEKARDDARKKREEAEKKRLEEENKRIEAAIKAMQTELDFYVASQGERKKSMEDQLKIDREVMRQSLAINKAEYDAKKKTRREFELANLEIQNEFAGKQIELVIENAEREFQMFMDANQRKIDANAFFSQSIYDQEIDRLNRISEAEAAQQTLRYEQGLINLEEYNAAIAAIDQEYYDNKLAVDTEREEAVKTKEAADLAIKIGEDEIAFGVNQELQNERYQQEYDQRKAAAIKNGADMLAFEKGEAEKKKKIDELVTQNKLQLASNAFGQLAAIAGEESAAGKAFAIAQAITDTYSSAVSSYNSLSGIPVVGPVLGGIAAAAAVAAGLANVKKIVSVKTPSVSKTPTPSYAYGGIGINGPGTGTSDSIRSNISAGESVITARATQMFPNTLGAINQAGGGVGLDGQLSSILNQNNIQSSAGSAINMEAISEAVALGAQRGTQQGTTEGMIGLANEREIQMNAKI